MFNKFIGTYLYLHFLTLGFKRKWLIVLKWQCHKIFDFRFSSWISFPQASEYPRGRFEFFRKLSEIFAAQGAPPVSLTPVANEKIFNQKNLKFLVCTPLGSRFPLRCKQSAIVTIICRRYQRQRQIYRRYRLPLVAICSLPPVLLTLAAILSQVSLTPVASLPSVSTSPAVPPVANFPPVVHLDLWISQWIFEKNRNDPNVILKGLGEGELWKKLEAKILWHCPFKVMQTVQLTHNLHIPTSMQIQLLNVLYEWKF